MKPVTEFYAKAYNDVEQAGYAWEAEYVWKIKPLAEQDPDSFFFEYTWCVLSGSGLREQVVRKIYEKFLEKLDFSTIKNQKRRGAIEEAFKHRKEWFENLLNAEDKIECIDSLPFMGPITKYHLARNVGIDGVIKPDRHLVRLAEQFGYATPLEMCKVISSEIGAPIGVVDVILWRWSNLFGTDQVGQTRLKV